MKTKKTSFGFSAPIRVTRRKTIEIGMAYIVCPFDICVSGVRFRPVITACKLQLLPKNGKKIGGDNSWFYITI
jgi:hypothetical protein